MVKRLLSKLLSGEIMYQTKILGNFSKYNNIRAGKSDQYENFTADCDITIANLKLQGKTDGILIYNPPLESDLLEHYLVRTWIDHAAAEEWITLRTAICVKHDIEITTYEIIEIV